VSWLVAFSPAPYHLLAAMLADEPAGGARDKLIGSEGSAKLQLLATGARSWGAWKGEHCLACAGLAPLDPAPGFEAWFVCRPELSGDLLLFVRLARLTLAELPDDAIVMARVETGHAPGERLARLLGFELAAPGVWERRKDR
jgi:hypothetical protein